jgi:hypothetical protein
MNWITKRGLLLMALLALFLGVGFAFAQPDVNPNARLSFPPPVYVLRGEVEVRGTVNVPNLSNYFISYRALDDEFEPLEEDFTPATALLTAPVVEDVLGVWDTKTLGDGLYELRLTVNVSGGDVITHDVSPVRVENILPPFLATQTPAAVATLPVGLTEEPAPSGSASITVIVASANVRTGDGTEYPVVTSLPRDSTASIIAISALGTDWYQIRLADGRTGWIAPSTVTVNGSLAGIPRVQPPPPPFTPTPVATATPVSSANLVAGIVVLDPAVPTCGQTFNVGFDVANLGSQQSFSSGVVSLVDTRAFDGSAQATTVGGFPILLPGQTFRVNMPLTVSTWYNDTHRINLVIDPGLSIPESNETDNTRSVDYVLQKGACP